MESQDQGHQPYTQGQPGQTPAEKTLGQPLQQDAQQAMQPDITPGTPPRPPYSPVTPVFAQLAPVQPDNATGNSIVPPPVSQDESPTASRTAQFASRPQNDPSQRSSTTANKTPAQFATEPPPAVPISESENPDAIALRSALSILQMQKQQSLRDMQTLDRMKKAAKADPERFARELAEGKLTGADRGFLTLDHDYEDEDEDSDEDGNGDADGQKMEQDDPFANLGKIPPAQNIVRMPPINWAKYQIVGESLDKMHAEQLRRPSGGEPLRAPEHILASPYRPLVDRLEGGGGK